MASYTRSAMSAQHRMIVRFPTQCGKRPPRADPMATAPGRAMFVAPNIGIERPMATRQFGGPGASDFEMRTPGGCRNGSQGRSDNGLWLIYIEYKFQDVYGRSIPMSQAEEFHAYARTCFELARTAATHKQRQTLVEMVEAWLRAAAVIEGSAPAFRSATDQHSHQAHQ
jgi:hypothetical protein